MMMDVQNYNLNIRKFIICDENDDDGNVDL